ncbi:MAG: hypothetical protein J1F35_03970 [Erysipelotrichales bacterium]|nr:hypothetical protein [Erysipelotrichales bacterium]
MEYIDSHLPNDFDQEKVDPIIYYLLDLISSYNYHYITWKAEQKRRDSENYFELNNGRPEKLVTAMNINYYKTFSMLYSFLTEDSGINPDTTKLEIK